MSKLTMRLLAAAIVVAGAQSVAALSISNPFRVTSTASGRIQTIGDTSPKTITFQRYTKGRPDADDTGGNLIQAAPVALATQGATTVGGSMSMIKDAASGAPAAATSAASPEFSGVPVTSVVAVVAKQTVKADSTSSDDDVAVTPIPASGLFLALAGLGLIALRRTRSA